MKNFRQDINGLRAYAVAFVVLFHFNIFGFSGGFVGVDVFFVISGFLMTKIIVNGIENNNFSLLKFYISRANRIIPALAILCLAIATVGWFTLTPLEYKDFGKHAATSLGFISNIQYFREAGYFDAASHEKLLLHTWSLSVEWQFYILLPIFLYFINRVLKSKNALTISFSLLLIVSFVLSIAVSKINPSAAFYLLPTRAWEMMAGGLIYLFLNKTSFSKRTSLAIELVGFSLIFASVALFSTTTLWPSYNALVPVLGTFLVLLAANDNSLFTNNKVAQFLGNTSYSIYLWHWPLVFYLNYLQLNDQSFFIAIAIAMSILLGWISYRFIETPSRVYLSSLTLKNSLVFFTSSLSIFLSFFIVIIYQNGLPARFQGHLKNIVATENDKNPRRDECHIAGDRVPPQCKYGTGDVHAIVLGDSHADAIVRAVEKSLPENTSLLQWTYSSCPLINGVQRDRNFKCAGFIKFALDEKEKYKGVPIIISNKLNFLDSNKDEYYLRNKDFSKESLKNEYIKTLCKFSENNPVYVLQSVPTYQQRVPSFIVHNVILRKNDRLSINLSDYRRSVESSYTAQKLASNKCNVKIINTEKYFCDTSKCYADKNGVPLYYDDNHLSSFGSDHLISEFKKIM